VADDQRTGRGITAKHVLIGVLVLIVVVLAIANSKKVKVDLVVTSAEIPLFLVIVGSALIGWVVGWFMGRSRDSTR
jgi:uncharacterized integral membrane protein